MKIPEDAEYTEILFSLNDNSAYVRLMDSRYLFVGGRDNITTLMKIIF